MPRSSRPPVAPKTTNALDRSRSRPHSPKSSQPLSTLRRPIKTTDDKRPEKRPRSISQRNNKAASFYNSDPLFHQLEQVSNRIDDLPPRVILDKYRDSEAERAKWREWKARVKPVRAKLEQFGVKWKRVLPIIAPWRSLVDVAAINQFALAFSDAKTQVSNQITARKRIKHYISSITSPPLRGDLKQGLQEDCNRALRSLEREYSAFQEALRILKKSGASALNLHNRRRRKAPSGRDPATRLTVEALDAVLTSHMTSKRARAQMIVELLQACDPEYAPKSLESIRHSLR